MSAIAILEEFERRGVQLGVEAGRIIARPLSVIPPDLRKAAAEHKPELVEAIVADEALALLNRLKCFTLPARRIPAARVIAERCAARLPRWEDGKPVFELNDPVRILEVLREIEGGLIALGGTPDPLIEGVEMVKRTFPGSRLVDVRKPRK